MAVKRERAKKKNYSERDEKVTRERKEGEGKRNERIEKVTRESKEGERERTACFIFEKLYYEKS